MADDVSVTNANLDDVEFTGGDGISSRATVSLDLEAVSQDPEESWTSEETYSCKVSDYLSGHGFEMASVG
jgi:hypothetical protein